MAKVALSTNQCKTVVSGHASFEPDGHNPLDADRLRRSVVRRTRSFANHAVQRAGDTCVDRRAKPDRRRPDLYLRRPAESSVRNWNGVRS